MSSPIWRLSMPSPLVVLPCGSMSTSRTRRPISASAAPRLTAVVLFPTPPFWLTIAMTRRESGFGIAGRHVIGKIFESVGVLHQAVACIAVGIDLGPGQAVEHRDESVAQGIAANHQLAIVASAVNVRAVESRAGTPIQEPLQ